jgi:serine/threonine-protein kinase
LSPDGHWIAYVSDESGRFDVYVRPTTGPDRRRPASVDGGTNAMWHPGGGELIYRQGNRMMSVAVRADSQGLELGKPVILFEQRFETGTSITFPNFDIGPDGRFVVIRNQANSGRLDVVLNWTEELKRLTGR